MFRSVSSAIAALALALTLCTGAAFAQNVPAYQMKVLDLVFHVEDMAGGVENLGGKTKSMAVKESRTEVRIDLASDVLFDFDSSELLPKARKTLAAAAQIIRTRAHGQVRVLGYTDSKGSDAYNAGLSERRAQSVQTWFVNTGGLRALAFATEGFGAKNPVAPNTNSDGSDNPKGRSKNRRVEIIIAK